MADNLLPILIGGGVLVAVAAYFVLKSPATAIPVGAPPCIVPIVGGPGAMVGGVCIPAAAAGVLPAVGGALTAGSAAESGIAKALSGYMPPTSHHRPN